MAKRPNNHITGDYAVRRINSDLIPKGWVINESKSDYGLDLMVEVASNSITTGRFFFIQAKGTDKPYHNGKISYSISLERIIDYSKVDIPILFVFYSECENKFWGRWMNSVLNTLTERERKQKSVSLVFTVKNEIDSQYLRSIGDSIQQSTPFHYSLSISSIPKTLSRFNRQIIRLVRGHLGDSIVFDSPVAAHSIEFSYGGSLSKGTVTIEYLSNSVSLPIDVDSIDFLYYRNLDVNEVPGCVSDILFALAFLSSRSSCLSREFVLNHLCSDAFILFSAEAWFSFIEAIPLERIDSFLSILGMAITKGRDDIAQAIIFRAFILSLSNNDINDYYNGLLEQYMLGSSDNVIKGRLCYNLANSVKHIDPYRAVMLYFKAVKFEPEYRDLYYWWKETAGILYVLGHYYWAEKFYKQARTLGGGKYYDDLDILIADCLVSQGKIQDAILEEHHYIEFCPHKTSTSLVKCRVTKQMSKHGISTFDPIYWFNEGVSRSHSNNHRSALDCFLYAWRLNDGDVESISNAIVEAFNVGDSKTISLLVGASRELYPEQVYEQLTTTLLSNHNQSDNLLESLIDSLEELLNLNS